MVGGAAGAGQEVVVCTTHTDEQVEVRALQPFLNYVDGSGA